MLSGKLRYNKDHQGYAPRPAAPKYAPAPPKYAPAPPPPKYEA